MKELINKIALEHYIDNQTFDINKLNGSIKKVIENLPRAEIIRYLNEARDNNYATYQVKKDRVIANVSAQKASVFTHLAKSWQELDKKVEDLENKKRALNDLKNQISAEEEELHQKIKDKIVGIFDDSEQTMTLVVECLNSSFTLSKFTEANADKIVTKQGEIVSTDYKKVVQLLLEQNEELKGVIDTLIRESSVIAAADIVKPGAKRRLKLDVTENINEGLGNRIISALNRLASNVKLYLNKLKSRQNLIDNYMDKLFI